VPGVQPPGDTGQQARPGTRGAAAAPLPQSQARWDGRARRLLDQAAAEGGFLGAGEVGRMPRSRREGTGSGLGGFLWRGRRGSVPPVAGPEGGGQGAQSGQAVGQAGQASLHHRAPLWAAGTVSATWSRHQGRRPGPPGWPGCRRDGQDEPSSGPPFSVSATSCRRRARQLRQPVRRGCRPGGSSEPSWRPPRKRWLYRLGCSRETSDRSHLVG
jgi:hypothetical protein